MDSERMAELAAGLWVDLGYDGCKALREALRLRMADHRATVAAARREAGLSRPRSARKPTSSNLAALAFDGSETGVSRAAAVKRYAPHLVPEVMAGNLKLWPAYREAMRLRDVAAIAAATD